MNLDTGVDDPSPVEVPLPPVPGNQASWPNQMLTSGRPCHIFSKMKNTSVNNQEKDVLDSYEQDQWRPVKNRKREIKRLQQYAQNTLQKDKRINVRMSSKDLDRVRVIATQQGIPYQTLISSIIHKYVSGYLKEEKMA